MRALNVLWQVLAVAAYGLGAEGAQAATVQEVFEKYNQIGTFAWDCSKPASGDNRYYVNRVIDPNHVQRDEMIGPTTREYVAIIDKASSLGPNEFALSGKRGNQTAEAVWRIEQNRQMAMEVTFDGKKVISGGKLVSNGRPVPWTNKCGAPGQQGQAAPAQQAQAMMPAARAGRSGARQKRSRSSPV